MDWFLCGVKAKRVLRRMPMQAMDEFALLFSKGNLITFFLALIGSYLIVQNGSEEAMQDELVSWEIAVNAFAIVLIGWGALSGLCHGRRWGRGKAGFSRPIAGDTGC